MTSHTFPCASCGSPAATLRLVEEAGAPVVEISGFVGLRRMAIPAEVVEPLQAALAAGDASGVARSYARAAGFFCRGCSACYCAEHWETRGVFHDYGWEHEERGTCPRGHEQRLDP